MDNLNTNDPVPNTTSCVSDSPDVRQAPAEVPQPTEAAKKRAEKAKKGAYKAIVKETEGIESIRLNGDAAKDAKEADLATADEDYVKSVQKDAEYLANPWSELPAQSPYVLDRDLASIDKYNTLRNNDEKIIVESLPEPFIGNPQSARVVLLNLNPGHSEDDAKAHSDKDGAFDRSMQHHLM
jgi:hypothetical protein